MSKSLDLFGTIFISAILILTAAHILQGVFYWPLKNYLVFYSIINMGYPVKGAIPL